MRLVVSFSPHTLSGNTTGSYFTAWLTAAAPACLAGIWFYGLRAVVVLGVSVLAAVLSEALCRKIMGREMDLSDRHAALLGLLLGLCLSPATPWWVAAIGAFVTVVLGKWLFGGLGFYPFHPVLVGWAVCYISFPALTINYMEPAPGLLWPPAGEGYVPLLALKMDPSEMYSFSLATLFWGNYAGPIGATSALALILGGLYLFKRGLVTPHIPVGFLIGLGLLALVYQLLDSDVNPGVLWHFLSGTALLAALLLAPEPTTSPVTPWGMLLFGLGAGLTCFFIRHYGPHPDGAFYGVLVFNALTPILDRFKPKPFGRTSLA